LINVTSSSDPEAFVAPKARIPPLLLADKTCSVTSEFTGTPAAKRQFHRHGVAGVTTDEFKAPNLSSVFRYSPPTLTMTLLPWPGPAVIRLISPKI
jgi:hypothetical protein